MHSSRTPSTVSPETTSSTLNLKQYSIPSGFVTIPAQLLCTGLLLMLLLPLPLPLRVIARRLLVFQCLHCLTATSRESASPKLGEKQGVGLKCTC